jgi:uncharacterized 2Fe-2S/4Fe-4S cluster protein (DUF4445 family)
MLEAASRAALTIETPCGGQGTCGKCRVHVTAGAATPTPAEADFFSPDQLAEGWRLSCQTTVHSAANVNIPESSLLASKAQILAQAHQHDGSQVSPAVRKVHVQLAAPTLADGQSDLTRLEGFLGTFKADLELLRRLPSILRQEAFAGTAVLTDHHLIDFEPGDTTGVCYGAAFDIGTTTLVGSLLDLCTGAELAITSRINPQVNFGDDVLSRINYASQSPQNHAQVQRTITDALGEMIHLLCQEAGIRAHNIYEISLAGNTTMEHLVCGIDVKQLGIVPFVPVHNRGLVLSARELGLPIHPQGTAYVFPVIGGFVGGDTVAGMIATRLPWQDGPVLMVDIGTNGEIVLAHQGKLYAASTAAGPAFEGARISCGMRATVGAIEKVTLDGTVHCGVIGENVPPIGICGSGLIDLAAQLLDCGIVTPEGRMLPPDELPASLNADLRARVIQNDNGAVSFMLAQGSGDAGEVNVTQRDIRELQLATGAIRAGIGILLRQASVRTSDLKRIFLAGGFGSFIRRNHAQRIGLLPADIEHSKIVYVGNASLNGARCALLSTELRKQGEELAAATTHVELSQDPMVQMDFAEAMIFPE